MSACTANLPPPSPSEPTALLTEGQETEEFWTTVSGKGPHPFLDAAKVTSCVLSHYNIPTLAFMHVWGVGSTLFSALSAMTFLTLVYRGVSLFLCTPLGEAHVLVKCSVSEVVLCTSLI